MKKCAVTLLILTAFGLGAAAQQRTVLYEEFSSDNNPSCATANPVFWGLCNTGANPTKMIELTYMASIPSGTDSFYYQDSAVTNNRLNYYNSALAYTLVGGAFAPSGFRDGLTPDVDSGIPGQPMYMSQYDIDSEYANPSNFNLSVTNSWNATYDSVYVSVSVLCVNAYVDPGTNLMLRLALVQNVSFSTPPGSDGETNFNHVVQAMYPTATGTSVGSVWLLGSSATYTFACAMPYYVNKSGSPVMVAWLQNDSSMFVEQAAMATPLAGLNHDAALISASGPGFACVPSGTYNAPHSVVLQNNGISPLTSATIYYSIDGGALSSYTWTGGLATSASVTVTMPTIPVAVSGASPHMIYDSVAMPDGFTDLAPGNNVATSGFFVENSTGLSMPFTTGFETAQNQFYSDNLVPTDSEQWEIYTNGAGPSFAHRGVYAASYHCYNFNAGDVAVLTMPEVVTSIPSAMDFWVSYAEFSSTAGTFGDTLDVVYSTDCGATWTTIWTQSGAALATVPTDSNFYMPTDSTNYVEQSISLNTVPSGAIIGFSGHSGYGNNIWLDDINIRTGPPLSTQQIAATPTTISLFPDPARESTTLTFGLTTSGAVQITIVDALGRTIATIADGNLPSGAHSMTINTAQYAEGVYTLVLRCNDGITTKRFVVMK